MADRLNGVSVFVQAAEAGGFAQAGERLGLSRSAVGKAVARLEARLGARLFHRTTRSQSLTDDGQAFYERCVRALNELEAGAAALDSGRREPVGRLRVSMPVTFGRRCVAPILVDLARAHPGLRLDLAFSDRPVDLIEEGFDLAIRNGLAPDGAGLMSRRLSGQRMTVCASPAYLARRGTPASLEDLADHEAVLYSRGAKMRTWLFPDADGRLREATVPSRLRFDDLEAIAAAAVDGMGLAWLPCWLVAPCLARGELVRVLADEPGLVFDSYALWPQGPHLPSRVRVAIDALAARMPALMS
ncbi:LysR family transcriptional regulator [Caulobacter sp. CCUG 60055]|uniref:LysR family transcriptional regulator n=1 Tax=Caulobacter sp. CCUG 60055 TaxID=2100090 RepID=UPI001FA7E038|nr:LysR family transcriptional regulator [Caulobacter sp. CCUG 60055]MCI3179757.1 LysR family transcriptional regulator [Caulobacter sp. CCUG 60055]